MGIIQIAPRDRLPEKGNPPFAPFWFDPFLIRPIEPFISAIGQSNERGLFVPAFSFPDSHLRCVRAPNFDGKISRIRLRVQNSGEKKIANGLRLMRVMRKIGPPELRILLEVRSRDPLSH